MSATERGKSLEGRSTLLSGAAGALPSDVVAKIGHSLVYDGDGIGCCNSCVRVSATFSAW